jgi:hypothetical protein
VEIHRESFFSLSRASDKKGGIRLVRYIGVDLHKTNFVVCFLNQDESFRLETFPLSKAGISRFTSELSKDDAVAVEVTQNIKSQAAISSRKSRSPRTFI